VLPSASYFGDIVACKSLLDEPMQNAPMDFASSGGANNKKIKSPIIKAAVSPKQNDQTTCLFIA